MCPSYDTFLYLVLSFQFQIFEEGRVPLSSSLLRGLLGTWRRNTYWDPIYG